MNIIDYRMHKDFHHFPTSQEEIADEDKNREKTFSKKHKVIYEDAVKYMQAHDASIFNNLNKYFTEDKPVYFMFNLPLLTGFLLQE